MVQKKLEWSLTRMEMETWKTETVNESRVVDVENY